MIDPYEIFHIDESATLEDVKYIYKSLVQKHHPDKGGDEEYFKKIIQAYKILLTKFDPKYNPKYHKDALNYLNNLVTEQIEFLTSENDDLIERMRFVIREEKRSIFERRKNNDMYLFKLNVVIKKLKTKGNRENFLSSRVVEERLKTLQISDRINYEINLCEYMLNLLDDFFYSENDVYQFIKQS